MKLVFLNMRVAMFFLLIVFISTVALLGGLTVKNSIPNFLVATGAWIFFFWAMARRRKKKDMEKRKMEKMFQDHMRFHGRR